MKIFVTLTLLILSHYCMAQAALTPEQDMGMHTDTIIVPLKFQGKFPPNKVLRIPNGYKMRLFHAGGLIKPRFFAFSPAGVLHVSDMRSAGNGKVFAFPDLDQDGMADTSYVAADGFYYNHDIRFYKGDLYVTESIRVWKCRDTNNDGYYETKSIFIDNIGDANYVGHVTRTLVFDSINHKAYLSVGSSCNACRETKRAIIEQYNDDGTGKRTFATGIRNAVGMTLHPVTNKLWANNNGNDNQGNEIPPEWIDVIRDGGFYGQPFAYGNKVWYNFDAHTDYVALKPITAADSQNVAKMQMPAALVRAHSAPMAIHFLNNKFPAPLQKGFLVALRGSWNTTLPKDFRGYKVVYAHLGSDTDTTVDYVSDFCSGFLTDSVNRVYWGRPVGLATDANGNVYISSDETNAFILQLYPDKAVGIEQIHLPDCSGLQIYPNPAGSKMNIQLSLYKEANVELTVYDLQGRAVYKQMQPGAVTGDIQFAISVSDFPVGLYLVKVSAGQSLLMGKVQVLR